MSIISNRPYKFVNASGEIEQKARLNYLRFIPHRLFFFATAFDQSPQLTEPVSRNGYTHMMLVPAEIEPPVIFQRRTLLDTYLPIRNRAAFYAQP
jgi:hypothetical protein